MNTLKRTLALGLGFGLLAAVPLACAHQPPPELIDAREAHRRASTGPAAKAAPAELDVARKALAAAERSLDSRDDMYRTKDLAYVALRRAELAEATASISRHNADASGARKDFVDTQGQIISTSGSSLGQAKSALAASEGATASSEARLADEKAARERAEERAAKALAALSNIAAVKDEPRGMVITLSGSVLFATNKSTLLPQARERINDVADVLMANEEGSVIVEGHTDSRGSQSNNQSLSQRRADEVRTALIQRGLSSDQIRAVGKGQDSPIADNSSVDGRANNRRVEIILERK